MKWDTPKRIVLAYVAIMLFAVTGTVSAQGYLGAGAGITTVDLCDDFSGPGVSCDDKDTGMKIFGGFKFNPNFGVEASWVDLGEVSVSDPGGSASVEVDGFGVAAVGMIPINPNFSVFGKLGAYMWDASGGGLASGSSDDGTDIMFGAGVNWNFTSHFGVRAEWERFDIDGDDVDFLSIGAQYNF